jgi:hypothetical protein
MLFTNIQKGRNIGSLNDVAFSKSRAFLAACHNAGHVMA